MVLWAQGAGNGRTDLLVSALPSATLGNINCLTRSEMKLAEEWEINYFSKQTCITERGILKTEIWWCFHHKVILLLNQCKHNAKTFIFTHLKNLEIQFCNQLKNLPNEEFQWVSNLYCRNFKIQHFAISVQEQPTDVREDGNWWCGLQ